MRDNLSTSLTARLTDVSRSDSNNKQSTNILIAYLTEMCYPSKLTFALFTLTV